MQVRHVSKAYGRSKHKIHGLPGNGDNYIRMSRVIFCQKCCKTVQVEKVLKNSAGCNFLEKNEIGVMYLLAFVAKRPHSNAGCIKHGRVSMVALARATLVAWNEARTSSVRLKEALVCLAERRSVNGCKSWAQYRRKQV